MKIIPKLKQLQSAILSKDKKLIARLTEEVKAESAKRVIKAEKLCKDIKEFRNTSRRI